MSCHPKRCHVLPGHLISGAIAGEHCPERGMLVLLVP
jgi:hypothetical protein